MYHEPRGKDYEFVRKVVCTEEIAFVKVRDSVEPYRQIGEACDTCYSIGACGLEHQDKEFCGVVCYFEYASIESGTDSESKCRKGCYYHGQCNCRNAIEVENVKGYSHDDCVRNGVEYF